MRAGATLVRPLPYSGLLACAAFAGANQPGGVLSNKIVDATWPSAKASIWQLDHRLPTPIGHRAGLIAPEHPSFPVVKYAVQHAAFLAMGQGTL